MTRRIAVIGAGYMGEKHARIYSTFKDVNLVGICDAVKERREKVASEFKTKGL